MLRYSATHRVAHTKVHRLDALDAYSQKLVKKIAVRGITVQGLAGTTAYLYLDAIEIAQGRRAPGARRARGAEARPVSSGRSGGLRLARTCTRSPAASRRTGACSSRTSTPAGTCIELSNGKVIALGQVTADVTEEARRRIQIREVIRAHLDKERELFPLGIKVLSLFFIDEVAKYRDYGRADTLGEYARAFVEEYRAQVGELRGALAADPAAAGYLSYLAAIPVESTHRGYFSDRQEDRAVNRR